MAEGLYRGWDELRSVPTGSQSGLRVIVLFTDGSANGVPGFWDATGIAKSVSTSDFPDRSPDPDNITTNNPQSRACTTPRPATAIRRCRNPGPTTWTEASIMSGGSYTAMSWLPSASAHTHHRSARHPDLVSVPEHHASGRWWLADLTARPDELQHRSEQIPRARAQHPQCRHEPRRDHRGRRAGADEDGDQPIRIFSIGMGELVQMLLGARPESSESVLIRIANDARLA